MTPKISVIVPVYNVEKYLSKCLDSLINQTLKDIEIICVDDASTDKSVEIIRHYIEKDKRISLLQHSQNKGLGAARNTGIKAAKSELIAFVDSDDYVDLDTYEKVVKNIGEDIDLLCFGTEAYNHKEESRKKSDEEYYAIRYSGKIPLSNDILLLTNVSSCNKIFKKSIIEKYQISYPEGLRYEDAYFFYVYCFWVKNIFFMPDKFYHYLRRDNSIMDETFCKKPGCSIDHTKIVIELYHYIKKHNLFDRWSNFFFDRFLLYTNLSLWHEDSKVWREKIYNLANSFLKKEKLNELIPSELLRDYKLLEHRVLGGEMIYKLMGLIKIQETRTKYVFYILGIPVLRIKYKKGKCVLKIFGIPVYKWRKYDS